MLRVALSLLCVASLAWCENGLSRQERKEGFQLLFNGKNLEHWHSIKGRPDAGPWRVKKGVISYESGESWLATDETYSDFVFRFEYRTGGASSNSGVFLRAEKPGDGSMEIEIASDAGKPASARTTGSIWSLVAPSKSANKPDGEWNQVEITVEKRRVAAVWNGERILDVNLDDPKYPALATKMGFGHIALQAHASGAPVEFRNLKLKVIKIAPQFL